MVSTRSGSLSAKRSSSDDNNNSNSKRSSPSEDNNNHNNKPPSPKRLKVKKKKKLYDFFGVVMEKVFDLFLWISGREWWSYGETDADDGKF
jgi:hypothetical protein